MNKSLDHEKFVFLKKRQLESRCEDQKEVIKILNEVRDAAESIFYRNQCCIYHYAEIIGVSQKDLMLYSLGQREIIRSNIHFDVKVFYSVHYDGFLQQFHAMIDSFPYLLRLLFYYEHNENLPRWDKRYLNKYEKKDFYNDLLLFHENEILQEVKCCVNRAKHRFIPRLRNYLNGIYGYSNGDVMIRDVVENVYNNLMPNFLDLCNKVMESMECELDADSK